MSGLPKVHLTGTVVSEAPELQYTKDGAAVVRFRVACNKRVQDPTTKEWRDAATTFVTVIAWRGTAENAAESLVRGNVVTVSGDLVVRTFVGRDDKERTAVEVVDAKISVDLTHQVADITRRRQSAT